MPKKRSKAVGFEKNVLELDDSKEKVRKCFDYNEQKQENLCHLTQEKDPSKICTTVINVSIDVE